VPWIFFRRFQIGNTDDVALVAQKFPNVSSGYELIRLVTGSPHRRLKITQLNQEAAA